MYEMSTRNVGIAVLRRFATGDLRRADLVRDERQEEKLSPSERWLTDLSGWLPVRTVSRARVDAFGSEITARAARLRDMADSDVVERFRTAQQFLHKAHEGALTKAALIDIFACIGAASHRRLGLSPHPVQYAGAHVLLHGQLAEMQTGEGKSLVAAIAAATMAGAGVASHIVSTNDYLAQRDCEEMAPLFAFFGLTDGYIKGGMQPAQRGNAYRQDVCYVSGKELVFDYLKDRLAGHGVTPARVAQLRQWVHGAAAQPPSSDSQALIPALHFAIVDEADSVLIDEARTPMIISRETTGLFEQDILVWAIASARGLRAQRHFRISDRRTVELLPDALAACPAVPKQVRSAWQSAQWQQVLIRQALTALHLFNLDQQYIIIDGKVQIVDESTGRTMPDRSWEQGLHQLIEVKEGLAISSGRETLARMTFQRFFRRYFLLAGLTGTAAEAARELWQVYRLRIVKLPPDKPCRRQRLADLCVNTQEEKWNVVATEAATITTKGQAVLVGTRSVEASEQLSHRFTRLGLPHVVLNARQDQEEHAIVEQAGRSGKITVATNMAGRGTDIKLDAQARNAGGLHVILTEFHDSPRIDRQLFGRSARQGEPGSVRAIIAADDTVLAPLPPFIRAILARSTGWALRLAVRWVQYQAERKALRERMQTLKHDQELSRLIGYAGKH